MPKHRARPTSLSNAKKAKLERHVAQSTSRPQKKFELLTPSSLLRIDVRPAFDQMLTMLDPQSLLNLALTSPSVHQAILSSGVRHRLNEKLGVKYWGKHPNKRFKLNSEFNGGRMVTRMKRHLEHLALLPFSVHIGHLSFISPINDDLLTGARSFLEKISAQSVRSMTMEADIWPHGPSWSLLLGFIRDYRIKEIGINRNNDNIRNLFSLNLDSLTVEWDDYRNRRLVSSIPRIKGVRVRGSALEGILQTWLDRSDLLAWNLVTDDIGQRCNVLVAGRWRPFTAGYRDFLDRLLWEGNNLSLPSSFDGDLPQRRPLVFYKREDRLNWYYDLLRRDGFLVRVRFRTEEDQYCVSFKRIDLDVGPPVLGNY